LNFNIALNTIIYIIVFLFPGILFRKFYFSGKFGNQFEQGNLLERFLWILLSSVVCMLTVGLLFYSIEEYFDLQLLNNISFEKIIEVFQSLSQNKFPQAFSTKNDMHDFVILILAIYVISGFLGYLLFRTIRVFSLDSWISILKFSNNWEYLAQAYKANGVSKKFGDVHTTYVDVLTKSNNKEELYRGILHNFIIDKDNKLENIIISNCSKFISIENTKENKSKIKSIEKSIKKGENVYHLHKDFKDKKVFKKSIDGNLLVLSNENIINLNFTYIKTSNNVNKWKTYFFYFINFFYYTFLLGLIIIPFLEFQIFFLQTILQKIVFSTTSFLVSIVILNAIRELLFKKNVKEIGFKDMFFTAILLATPYLWVFDIFSALGTIMSSIIVLFIFAAFQKKTINIK
jgi:hypothetical protein